MNWFNVAKSAGSVIGLIMLGTLLFFARDRFAQKAVADAAERCAAAVGKPSAPLDDCAPSIVVQVNAARQGAICDGALFRPAAETGARFVIVNACGAGVKRLFAERDVLGSRVDNLSAVLAGAAARSDAAVARAEGRAATLNERKADARKAIEAAPRDGVGRIICDAECLHRLSQ